MFFCCEELETLPDISKWDTRNVTNMQAIFAKTNLNLYQIYLNGIQKILLIWLIYLVIVFI